MTSLHKFAAFVLLPVGIAVAPCVAGASPVSGTGAALSVTTDTTFNPSGSYTLDLSVGGQAVTMNFSVQKKADGSFEGVFKHEQIGVLPTTSFKVDGRKLTMSVVTEGGPATITLTVNKESIVEGEWHMEGDGSKISGKKSG